MGVMKTRATDHWYFDTKKSRADKLRDWIVASGSFYTAENCRKFNHILGDSEGGVRMVVNIGAYALFRFLSEDKYKNGYDLNLIDNPELGETPPSTESKLRIEIDQLLGFSDPADVYFGAAALESGGVRFYGEYCMVLEETADDTGILYRDSYEFVFRPLCDQPNREDLIGALRGSWGTDIMVMSCLKIRNTLAENDRLVTEGRMRDALLRGEEFIEVHRIGTFGCEDLQEIRQTPADVATHEHIIGSYERGVVPNIEELVWVSQCAQVARRIQERNILSRVTDSAPVR